MARKYPMNIVKKHGAIVLAIVGLALAGTTAQAVLSPTNLRCAMRLNPLGIGDATPRLSWQFQSAGPTRGETQSAYQVHVGSSAGAADLWDSGKVASAATMDIASAGQPLTSGQRCFWQVRFYAGSNQVSA